jgi:N-carbamoyl-D-amino-acid hydrolase
MSRIVRVAAAQLGPIAQCETRAQVVDRLISLLHKAHGFGATLVVYPECALTTFEVDPGNWIGS